MRIYKDFLLSKIEIPKLVQQNSTKTTTLKIFSSTGNVIFSRYMNYGGVIKIGKDFKQFNSFYRDYVNFIGKDMLLEKYWNQFYLKNKDYLFFSRYEEFLKKRFLKRLLEKFSLEQIYEIELNNYQFANGVRGVNGYSVSLFNKEFNNLSYKEKIFLVLCVIYDLKDAEKNYSYLSKMSTILSKDDTKVEFHKPRVFEIYSDYLDGVFKELENFHLDFFKKSYAVYTSFDENIYKINKEIIKNSLKKYKDIEAGFVLVDYHRNEVVSVNGSIRDVFSKNRAISVKREVGSIFKPITYLTAFYYGFRPSYVLEDKPYKFKEGKHLYTPKNFKNYYMGKTNIRNGLIYSLNNLTVKLAEVVGLKKVTKIATQLGFEKIKPFYAMPLGSIPQTPLVVAKAYSTIASYGKKCEVTFIKRVIDDDGNVMKPNKRCKRVVDEGSAYQVLFLMKKVVQFGTAKNKGLIFGTAGKTGTSNNSKDCWFVGIFPPYVAVLWVGYDDFKTIEDDATGGKIAAPIVARIEKRLLKNVKRVSFKVPKGIVLKKIVRDKDLLYSDNCGNYYYEMLKKENIPKECIRNSIVKRHNN
ncbi:transglycosylase domain-containing protein [Deferribacter abyssi]|uniref:transglycosylase domain-containing protein n=1 Tax=Deferribacter abyssi TaxID=213806 RepID=UPI003C2708F7